MSTFVISPLLFRLSPLTSKSLQEAAGVGAFDWLGDGVWGGGGLPGHFKVTAATPNSITP